MLIGANGLSEISVPPAAKYIPASYDLLIGGAPMMRAHWFDLLDPEFNGSTFTKTFIWGSNNGKFVFLEPMITHDYLLTKPNSEKTLRQPTAFQRDGWYPGSYTVTYSPSTKEYTIALKSRFHSDLYVGSGGRISTLIRIVQQSFGCKLILSVEM
jgi:hypothetical protein